MNPLALGMLGPTFWGALLILAVASNGCSYFYGKHSEAKEWQAKWNAEQTRIARQLLAEGEKQRAIESERRKAVDDARKSIDLERRRNTELSRLVVISRGDADRLRDQLSAYAAGPASGDTEAACLARSATLAAFLAEGADLLREGTELAAEAAKAADDRSSEVEGLLQAWPK